MVNLRKDDRPRRSVGAAPFANPPLKRPPLRVGKLPGIPILEPCEQGKGLQARLGFQANLNLWPHVGERVEAGPPRPLRRLL